MMSNWVIFAVGLFTTLLLGGGLIFTILEFQHLGKSLESKERVKRSAGAGGESRERAA